MPKLFFRKKKKSKDAKKAKDAKLKPHISAPLAPPPAFVAVPSTPPPSKRNPTAELQERWASMPNILSADTCDQKPVGIYSMMGPSEDQSDSEASEPGYASVRRDSSKRFARLLDATPSQQSRLATPPRATADDSPTPSRAQREPLPSSSLQERLASTSKQPNIASELRFHSDSSHDLVTNPIPKDREGSSNQFSDQQQPQKKHSQENEQLYSRVNKPKDSSRSVSAELPPKSPRSRIRGNQSPHSHTRGSQPSPSKGASSPSKQLPRKELSPRVTKALYPSASTPKEVSSGDHSEKTPYVNLSSGVKGNSRLDWQGSPGNSQDADWEEEDDTPEQAYIDDDSVSDEQLENCSYDRSSVPDSVSSEATRAKRHQRSATHPTHRSLLSSDASKKSQDDARQRRSASYRHRSSLPHVHTGGETSPAVHPRYIQAVSRPPYNPSPVFLMPPDGSVQYYYTAAPMHSQSSLHTPHAHHPALGWQPAPLYQPSVSPLTPAMPHQLDPVAYTQGQPRFSVQHQWHQQQIANLVDAQRVDQPQVPCSAKQSMATSTSPTSTSPQRTLTQTLLPKAAQQTSTTGPNQILSGPPMAGTEINTAGDPTPLQKPQAPHPPVDSLSRPSSKRPPSRKSPDSPHHGGRGDSALLSLSHGSGAPLLKGKSARVKRKIEFSDLNASWHGDTHVSSSRLPYVEAGDSDVEEAPTSSASPRLGTGPGHRVAPGQQDNKARVYRDLLCLVEQREAGLRRDVGTLRSANAELQEENSALKQLYEGQKQAASNSSAARETSQHWQPLDGEDPSRPNDGAAIGRGSQPTPPLVQTYKERVREKDKLLQSYQEEIAQLKAEISSITEENQALLAQSQESMIEQESWHEVAERARGVLEENETLQRQLELQREKAREVKREHQARVSQLSTEIAQLKKERQTLAKDLHTLRQSHAHFQDQFEQLASRSTRQVSLEEHQEALQEVQSLLEDLAEKSEKDTRTQEAHMRVLEKEKRALVTKFADAKAIIMQLEEECTSMHRANRKAQEQIALQKSELEASRDREVLAHEQLNRAVMQVEKVMAERETFAKIAKSQQKARDKASAHQARHEHAIGKLEKRLESCKQQAGQKMDTASMLLREQQRDYRSQRRYYEEELKQLRSLLAKKQEDVKLLARGKRDAEERLGILWRASTSNLQAESPLQ